MSRFGQIKEFEDHIAKLEARVRELEWDSKYNHRIYTGAMHRNAKLDEFVPVKDVVCGLLAHLQLEFKQTPASAKLVPREIKS